MGVGRLLVFAGDSRFSCGVRRLRNDRRHGRLRRRKVGSRCDRRRRQRIWGLPSGLRRPKAEVLQRVRRREAHTRDSTTWA